jgi:hypothetical protein
MAVYVDELFNTEKSRKWPYLQACHLTADTLEELHEFAISIGLSRSWFQDHRRHPHYDLTNGRRLKAVRLGAIEVSSREQAEKRIKEHKDG